MASAPAAMRPATSPFATDPQVYPHSSQCSTPRTLPTGRAATRQLMGRLALDSEPGDDAPLARCGKWGHGKERVGRW